MRQLRSTHITALWCQRGKIQVNGDVACLLAMGIGVPKRTNTILAAWAVLLHAFTFGLQPVIFV